MKRTVSKGRLSNLIELTYDNPVDLPEWGVEFDVGFTIIAKDKASAMELHKAVNKYGHEVWSDRSM